jgi:hypothetical protein
MPSDQHESRPCKIRLRQRGDAPAAQVFATKSPTTASVDCACCIGGCRTRSATTLFPVDPQRGGHPASNGGNLSAAIGWRSKTHRADAAPSVAQTVCLLHGPRVVRGTYRAYEVGSAPCDGSRYSVCRSGPERGVRAGAPLSASADSLRRSSICDGRDAGHGDGCARGQGAGMIRFEPPGAAVV